MNLELEHKIHDLVKRVEYRELSIKNHEKALFKDDLSYKRRLEITHLIERMKHEVKDFKKQITSRVNQYNKANNSKGG